MHWMGAMHPEHPAQLPVQSAWSHVIKGAQALHCKALQVLQAAAEPLGRQSLQACVPQDVQTRPHLRQKGLAHDWQGCTAVPLPHSPHGCFTPATPAEDAM